GGGDLGWPALLMVGSSLAFSAYQILSRIVGRTDSPVVSVFWALLVGAVIVTVLVPFHWTALDARLWGVFFAHGLFACLGHLLLVTSYRYAPAAHLAPFYYVQLIWSSLVGWAGFGEVPGTATLVGAALLAATGLFVARIKD
ncbi:MAG: DMT family transporter, partial [Alphaproteobacteria bacterium]|nr:DMT family transporter [Alphaproteobacteria bacterium]